MAIARSLVDTNILVYSRDLNEPIKRARAIEVIDQLGTGGALVLSARCWRPVVVSEDFQDGQEIERVHFVSRLRPSTWLGST